MIYAIDFDGTLVTDKFPEIGEAIQVTQDFVKARQKQGDKFILWTCRTGEVLEEAVNYCLNQGIIFDAVNENLPEIKEQWGGDTRKVYADYYIDDKSTIIINDLGNALTRIKAVGEVI